MLRSVSWSGTQGLLSNGAGRGRAYHSDHTVMAWTAMQAKSNSAVRKDVWGWWHWVDSWHIYPWCLLGWKVCSDRSVYMLHTVETRGGFRQG